METKTKLSDFGRFPTTPFIQLDNFEFKKYYKGEKSVEVTDTETGEVKILLSPSKLIDGFKDSNPYTKVFKNGQISIKELSVPGIKVLTYLQCHLKINAEDICLRPQEIADWSGYKTLKNVYVGLIELLNMGFIAEQPGGQSYYWINPNIFFNGDRIKLLENPARAEFVASLIANHDGSLKEYMNGL